MARARHSVAIAVLCRPNGTVLEVSHDKLGLALDLLPGLPFTSIVEPRSLPKAIRYLREIEDNNSASVCELEIVLPQGSCSLFFSGYSTTRGTVLVGCTKRLAAKSGLHCLAKLARRPNGSTSLARGRRSGAFLPTLTGCVDEQDGHYVLLDQRTLNPIADLDPNGVSTEDLFAKHVAKSDRAG
jgi:hypothetical protein